MFRGASSEGESSYGKVPEQSVCDNAEETKFSSPGATAVQVSVGEDINGTDSTVYDTTEHKIEQNLKSVPDLPKQNVNPDAVNCTTVYREQR